MILFEYEATSDTLTNLGFAISASLGTHYDLAALDPFVAFQVEEADHGADLNGDGDLLDRVVHVLDSRNGQVSNLGEAYAQGPSVVEFDGQVFGDDQHVVLALRETNNDLTGDGDVLDLQVVAAWSPQNGLRTWPLMGAPRLFGSEIRVGALELDGDLNGDGDQGDLVLHRVDLATGQITNLGLAGTFYGSTDLFSVSEAQQGVELDGNGLLDAWIGHVLDPVTGAVTNLGLRTYISLNAGLTWLGLPYHPDQVSPDWIPFTSQEATVDLNGNGVLGDWVLHAWDASLGAVVNLGAVTGLLETVYTDPQSGQHTVVSFEVEAATAVDVNGDGDLMDTYLNLVDEQGNVQSSNLSIAGSFITDILADGRWVTFLGWEPGQEADLNGDGDQLDRVVVTLDLATRRVVRHGWATDIGLYRTDGPRTYVFVAEQGSDLNGDGDGLDYVLHAFDAATQERVNIGLAAAPINLEQRVFLGAGYAFVTVGEAEQGNVDLNGDGDALDAVLFVHGPQL